MHQPDCSCRDGYLDDDDDDFYDRTCWKCHGTGVSPWLECDFCNEEFEEEQFQEDNL